MDCFNSPPPPVALILTCNSADAFMPAPAMPANNRASRRAMPLSGLTMVCVLWACARERENRKKECVRENELCL